MSEEEFTAQVKVCDIIFSSLLYNLIFKGEYARPCKLVRDIIARIHETATKIYPFDKVELIILDTIGIANLGRSDDKRQLGRHLIISI